MKRFIIGLILGIALGLSFYVVTCYTHTPTQKEIVNDSIPVKLEQPEFFSSGYTNSSFSNGSL